MNGVFSPSQYTAKFNFVPKLRIGIFGGPRCGKTSWALKNAIGDRIAAVPYDNNFAGAFQKYVTSPYVKPNLIVPFEQTPSGMVLRGLHVDDHSYAIAQQEGVNSDLALNRRWSTLLAETRALINHKPTSVVIDNITDIGTLADQSMNGIRFKRASFSDGNKARTCMQSYMNVVRANDAHQFWIFKEGSVYRSFKENGELKIQDTGAKKAQAYSGAAYEMNLVLRMVQITPQNQIDLGTELQPALKYYQELTGTPMRKLEIGRFLVICDSASADPNALAGKYIWINDPKDPDNDFYPDAGTLPNICGRLYPDVPQESWL